MNIELVPPASDERGASSVEYGLIAVAIAALIAVVVFAFGSIVNTMFGQSCETVKAEASPTSNCS